MEEFYLYMHAYDTFIVHNTLYNTMECWIQNYMEKEHLLRTRTKGAHGACDNQANKKYHSRKIKIPASAALRNIQTKEQILYDSSYMK